MAEFLRPIFLMVSDLGTQLHRFVELDLKKRHAKLLHRRLNHELANLRLTEVRQTYMLKTLA